MTYLFEKIVVNTSFGKLATGNADFNEKQLPEIKEAFSAIVGQAGQERKARISIAGFKIREGMIIALKATLRRKKMQQFIDRVVNIAMPRIRDFQGIPKSCVDAHGNLTFGIKEHIVFPEIVLERSRVNFGMEITIVPRKRMTHEQGVEFYTKFGIPFEKVAKKELRGKK
ncbi:MAG: 50S ribosomal protein L5 [Janthinobacterium sp.]|jgi:large subunit ribosomal protein L5